VVDKEGNSVGSKQGGFLVIRHPWPSLMRTIYGDPRPLRHLLEYAAQPLLCRRCRDHRQCRLFPHPEAASTT